MARIALTVLLLCSASLAAAGDLTGTWMGLLNQKGRRPARDVAFQLIQNGGQLGGKLYGEGPGSPIHDGLINSDGNVRFIVETREQAGNQINDVRYLFTGVVCQGALELTRERIYQRDAVSGVESPVRRPFDTDDEDRERRFDTLRLEKLF